MQLTQEVNVHVQVRITYKGADDLRISVMAVAPYAEGERSATVTHDIDDPDLSAEAAALCETILEAHAHAAARRAIRDAAQAEGVAMNRGEI